MLLGEVWIFFFFEGLPPLSRRRSLKGYIFLFFEIISILFCLNNQKVDKLWTLTEPSWALEAERFFLSGAGDYDETGTDGFHNLASRILHPAQGEGSLDVKTPSYCFAKSGQVGKKMCLIYQTRQNIKNKWKMKAKERVPPIFIQHQ